MKGKRKKSGNKKPKEDHNFKEVDNYEVSESDDDLGPDGKIMLERAKHGKYIQDESEEEVLRVRSSDDSEDEEEDEIEDDDDKEALGSDFDSDIEGAKREEGADLPSSKAWGTKNKRKFYDTDYVDQDFGGMGEKEEEAALMEEAEALAIQKRLMAELEGTDITLGMLDKVEEKKTELAEKAARAGTSAEERIRTDLEALSRDEKIRFLKTDSPELFSLIDDFKAKMKCLKDNLLPILDMFRSGVLPRCPASEAISLYRNLICTYLVNVCFYLVYKSSESGGLEGHPLLERLVALRKYLVEVESAVGGLIEKGKAIGAVDDPTALAALQTDLVQEQAEKIQGNRAERRKRKLALIKEMERFEARVEEAKHELGGVKAKGVRFAEVASSSGSEAAQSEEEKEEGDRGEERRGITYKMAKNKGLTPKKRKELRNPRVKHRNKFRKAKIRRKGMVREVRQETSRYGGEISGVKAYMSKSIKLK